MKPLAAILLLALTVSAVDIVELAWSYPTARSTNVTFSIYHTTNVIVGSKVDVVAYVPSIWTLTRGPMTNIYQANIAATPGKHFFAVAVMGEPRTSDWLGIEIEPDQYQPPQPTLPKSMVFSGLVNAQIMVWPGTSNAVLFVRPQNLTNDYPIP